MPSGFRSFTAPVVVAGLAWLALMSAPTAAAKEVADASCPGPPNSNVSAGTPATTEFAQPFTALNTGELTRAQVLITKGSGSTGDYVLSINTVDGSDLPTTTVLASTTIPNTTVPEGETVLVGSFAAPANVVSGQRYALVVSRPGGTNLFLRIRGDNPCSGQLYARLIPDPFSLVSDGVDMLFTVSVTPPAPVTPPPPAAAGTTSQRAAALAKCKKMKKKSKAKRKKCKKKANALPV